MTARRPTKSALQVSRSEPSGERRPSSHRALAGIEVPERVLHHEVEQTHAVGMGGGLARDDAREVAAEVEVGHAAEPALAHLLADLEQGEQAPVVEIAHDALPVLELPQIALLE